MTRLALLAAVTAVACKAKETPPPAPAPAPKPEPAETPPVPPTPTPTPAPAAGSAAAASTDALVAWCKTRSETFDKARCKNDNTDACFCEVGTKGREGQLVNGPDTATGTNGTILEATLVRVVDSAHDPIQCGVAARTATGWLVAERQFKCGGASVGDNEVNAAIDSFTLDDKGIHISGASDAFSTKLADDGHAESAKRKSTPFKLTCTVSGATLTCANAK